MGDDPDIGRWLIGAALLLSVVALGLALPAWRARNRWIRLGAASALLLVAVLAVLPFGFFALVVLLPLSVVALVAARQSQQERQSGRSHQSASGDRGHAIPQRQAHVLHGSVSEIDTSVPRDEDRL